MWSPIKRKSTPSSPILGPAAGWYCRDTNSSFVDPTRRYSSLQAAQKECERRNLKALQFEEDGKTHNPRRWYTVGYVGPSASLLYSSTLENPSHYWGYLSELLRLTRETMMGNHVAGAIAAVIWPGQLSRDAALHSPRALPIHHVFTDGRVTGPTA